MYFTFISQLHCSHFLIICFYNFFLQIHGTFKYKRNSQNNIKYLFKDNPDYCKFFLPDIIEDISE